VNTTGWLKGLRVTGDGSGIVSHAGVALIRALADDIGLTAAVEGAGLGSATCHSDKDRSGPVWPGLVIGWLGVVGWTGEPVSCCRVCE
jgi:hypothetical protein